MPDIKLTGAVELLKVFGAVPPSVRAAMLAIGNEIKGKISKYPRRRKGKQPFKTAKQRRAFFAKLHDSTIEVPYRRGQSPGSQSLGKKWTVTAINNGLTVIIGNNTDYGPFVQSIENQSTYHKVTGWKTTEEVMYKEQDNIERKLKVFVDKALELGRAE